jgi:beta-lactam-binding protein with PASTA domain/predicted Ser/Thr protein kinase
VAEIGEGTIVDGRYRIVRRIGSGGMADVWLAEDTHLQRHVALKVLHNRFAQDREFVERFRREAEAAAGLQHPNVVGVFDRGAIDGTYYIAMEYLQGRSLKELIDAGMEPEEAVRIVRQILEAAGFAHRNGIVHRDFKPQNVIVDSGGHVSVTDFGIARAGVSEITQTGSVMGTAHYLSPEQAQGIEVTPSSDLYSIGVILYEALTGKVPFEGDSAVAVALKQVSQTPQRPSAINPQVSPALDAVVMRALAKDPAQRFQDAAAFSAALEAAMRDPAATGPSTAAFAPLPPAAVAEEPAEAEERREEERRINRRWLLVLLAVVLGVLAALALTRDTTTEVPSVTGEQLPVAINLLQQQGFEVGERRRVQRDAPVNQVLEQDPSGEASEDCDFLSLFCSKPKVDLTISAGPGSAVVPDVRGEDRSDAAAALRRRGFGVEVETAFSDTFAEDTVIRTDPAAGESATRGSAVTMLVSRGQRLVGVPALVGLARPEAVGRIRERGLVASVSEEESNRPRNTVISQSPGPGSELAEGSTVSIVVSAGIPTVKVPGLVGMTRRDAVAELRQRGLEPVIEERDVAVEEKDGVVVQQDPTGGTELEEGDSVTIFIGRFVEPEPPAVTP